LKKYQFPKNEHGIQSAFFNWVRRNRKHSPNEGIRNALSLCYAIPNGLSTKESQKAKMEGLTSGIWDIALSRPVLIKTPFLTLYEHEGEKLAFETRDGQFWKFIPGLFMETKFGNNKLSPKQKEKRILFEDMGYRCEVCYSSKAEIETIIDYLPFPKEDYIEPEY